jgi:hypothetical protein
MTGTVVITTGPGIPPQPAQAKIVPDLTEEEYFRLYPQMRGVPRYREPLPPEVVNDLYAHRREVNRKGGGNDEEISLSRLIEKVRYLKRRETSTEKKTARNQDRVTL